MLHLELTQNVRKKRNVSLLSSCGLQGFPTYGMGRKKGSHGSTSSSLRTIYFIGEWLEHPLWKEPMAVPKFSTFFPIIPGVHCNISPSPPRLIHSSLPLKVRQLHRYRHHVFAWCVCVCVWHTPNSSTRGKERRKPSSPSFPSAVSACGPNFGGIFLGRKKAQINSSYLTALDCKELEYTKLFKIREQGLRNLCDELFGGCSAIFVVQLCFKIPV